MECILLHIGCHDASWPFCVTNVQLNENKYSDEFCQEKHTRKEKADVLPSAFLLSF